MKIWKMPTMEIYHITDIYQIIKSSAFSCKKRFDVR